MAANKQKSEIKIAHIIIIHQLPEQLKRLLLVLNHPQVHFFIHIDRKINENPFIRATEDLSNVTFIENRVEVTWGGFSIVEAILSCLKEISDLNLKFTHYNLLSGSDYPLKKADQFVDFLFKNDDKEFFEFYPVLTEWKEAIPRFEKYHLTDYQFPGKYVVENLINKLLPKRKVPYNMTLVGRLLWFTITEDLVLYILNFLKNNKKFLKFFKLTWGSDELFLQTIAYNSNFKEKMVNRSLRYNIFPEGQAHPKILNEADLSTLYGEEYFFARKFHPKESATLLDMIDNKLKD